MDGKISMGDNYNLEEYIFTSLFIRGSKRICSVLEGRSLVSLLGLSKEMVYLLGEANFLLYHPLLCKEIMKI